MKVRASMSHWTATITLRNSGVESQIDRSCGLCCSQSDVLSVRISVEISWGNYQRPWNFGGVFSPFNQIIDERTNISSAR